ELAVVLGGNYCTMGHFFLESGQAEAALPWYDRAVKTLDSAEERSPGLLTAQAFLRDTHFGKANALTHLKRHAEASKEWQQAAELAEGKAREPLTVEFGVSCYHAGNDVFQSGKPKEALPWYGKAIDALEEVRQRNAQDARASGFLASSHAARALA